MAENQNPGSNQGGYTGGKENAANANQNPGNQSGNQTTQQGMSGQGGQSSYAKGVQDTGSDTRNVSTENDKMGTQHEKDQNLRENSDIGSMTNTEAGSSGPRSESDAYQGKNQSSSDKNSGENC